MNVILLVLDALRYDYVNESNTPNLMKIAKKGAWFNNAFAENTSTIVSMPYLLCGQKEYNPDYNIATILNAADYHTAMIHSNPILHNFYFGFQEHIDLKSTKFRMSKKWKKTLRNNLPPQIINGMKKFRATIYDEDKYMAYARANETLDFSRKWMKEHEKYFLWIHLMEPHIPYYPLKSKLDLSRHEMRTLNDKFIESIHGNYTPTEEEIEYAKVLYSEDIAEMDGELGYFFDSINSDDLLIITADHGEEFGEHGQFSHHADKLVSELTKVPLIFYGDGIKPNTIIEKTESVAKIGQTIIDLLCIDEKLNDGDTFWRYLK